MNQTISNTTAAGAIGLGLAVILCLVVVSLAFYVFYCFCFKRICEKCGVTPGILVWIPIAQLVPLLQAAGMSVWMLLLMFVPFVNLVVGIMMWAKICTARGKSPWLVLLLFVPIADLVFLPYLAFSE